MPRIPALLLLTLTVVVGLAGPALAHTELVETSPAAGAVAAGGRAVTLTFTQEVDHRLASVAVRRKTGDVVSAGNPQRSGVVLVQPVTALTAGGYDVQWRAAAADGHILKGTFSFHVDGQGAAVSPGKTSERLSPADLLREHAKGNDHDSPAYAISAPEPASDADAAPAAATAPAPQEPAPVQDTAPTAIVALVAAALGVTLIAAGVESIRAHRV